ncbi:unnamed protein product [Sphagnum jensenii]|uniref:Uncharacterized protein n=1 Tax=Sphagnum jensenii TaxID=128206 RepID=A0ABP1C337_9BRYO
MGYGSCRTDGYSVGQWTILCEIHIQGQPPNWEDFLGILFLQIVNSTIRFIEENNAGNAIATLMAHHAPKTKRKKSPLWKAHASAETVLLERGTLLDLRSSVQRMLVDGKVKGHVVPSVN